MKTLLAKKQTEDQKRSNQFVRFQFIMAMMSMDYMTIKSFLKEEAKFLGWMNVWQFTAWLKKQFDAIGTEGCHSRYKEQICLDVYPGTEMFVFEYAQLTEDEYNEWESIETLNDKIYNRASCRKICLTLVFENGKISDVRVPKKGVDTGLLKKFQTEN
jgi:hypothetical protein